MAKNGPFWPARVQKDLAIFRPSGVKKSKKNFLLKITIYDPPKGLGASKTQNWPSGAPNGPPFGPFCDHFGPFWTQKTRFSRKNVSLLQVTLKASPTVPFVPDSILGVRLPHLWLNLAEDEIQRHFCHTRAHTRARSLASPSPKPKPRHRHRLG